MSHIITNKVRELKTGNQTAKSVLLRLADYANDAGECFPSTTRLADELEVSRQAVSKAIKLLEEIKVLNIIRGTGRHNCYQITPENYTGPNQKTGKPVNVDYMSTTITCNPSLQGSNPSLREPVNDVDTNHHRTIINHHSGVVNARETKNSDSIFENPKSENQFIPVSRKFMIPYFTQDSEIQTFHELENKYQVNFDFQAQAQASFPELDSQSIELLFNEYKRFWLTNQGFKQNPEKWMAHWITRVEKQKYSVIQQQGRQIQNQAHYQPKPNYAQAKQDNVDRWKNYGKEQSENTVIDVSPDFPKTLMIEEVGRA